MIVSLMHNKITVHRLSSPLVISKVFSCVLGFVFFLKFLLYNEKRYDVCEFSTPGIIIIKKVKI